MMATVPIRQMVGLNRGLPKSPTSKPTAIRRPPRIYLLLLIHDQIGLVEKTEQPYLER
jgi:hypothetical protein